METITVKGKDEMGKVSAYYSDELKCWVRLEKMEDGEYCHTSGYMSEKEALTGVVTTITWK